MKKLIIIVLSLLIFSYTSAQRVFDKSNNRLDNPSSFGSKNSKKKDDKKKENIPTGLHVWQADSRFGTVDSVAIDSFSHTFQNSNMTEGIRGQYNTLGNMGSPRLSRLFVNRPEDFSYFIFANPYDFFITPFSAIHFTNTKSPFTNISYHETLSDQNGEDRIKAIYAVNMNKEIGFGLKLDYLYGRGYYSNQATSDFNTTFFGSILKDQYHAHYAFFSNYLKTAENGGITEDDYVTNPENFPSKYDTPDIPTKLNKAWNKTHVDGFQWTHSYSLGFRRILPKDSAQLKQDSILAAKKRLIIRTDSGQIAKIDSSYQKDSLKIAPRTIFIPVTSLIHTLKVETNSRQFIANQDLSSFYTNKYFKADSTNDKFSNTLVSNLVALELHEGFNKWALAGIRLYAQHDYNNYKMPAINRLSESFSENKISIGGQIFKQKGENINYTLEAQTSSDGNSWGDFKLLGNGLLKVKLLGDSIRLRVHGSIINQQPTFFYRKYQSHYLWWDNNLGKQFSTHLGAVLESSKTNTQLFFDIQNIKNYTYLATISTKVVGEQTSYFTSDTQVRQEGKNVQLLSLILNQNFRLGILNWENQLAYQATTNQQVLPLPTISIYSNIYLLFHISKVLRTEFGTDVRYFTSYYAPTYSPAIGMFATQSLEDRVKVGNYPIVDLYANFHLKHTRFYVMASHVNYSKSSNGNKFLVPHYPINPFIIRLGLSWNFFN